MDGGIKKIYSQKNLQKLILFVILVLLHRNFDLPFGPRTNHTYLLSSIFPKEKFSFLFILRKNG